MSDFLFAPHKSPTVLGMHWCYKMVVDDEMLRVREWSVLKVILLRGWAGEATLGILETRE